MRQIEWRNGVAGHPFAHRSGSSRSRACAVDAKCDTCRARCRTMTAFAAHIAVARATLGGAFGRERGRLVLATLAIALGIALGFAIDLVNRTAVAEFASGMATLSGNADLEVRGPRAGFDESVYPNVARAEGVAVASPIVEVQAPVRGFDEPLILYGVDAF